MKRYVIFRVFADNKFGNKVIVNGGEILDSFNTIDEIVNSKYSSTDIEGLKELYTTRFEYLGHVNKVTDAKKNPKLLSDNFAGHIQAIDYFIIDTENKLDINAKALGYLETIKEL